jgi:hypothetical protein
MPGMQPSLPELQRDNEREAYALGVEILSKIGISMHKNGDYFPGVDKKNRQTATRCSHVSLNPSDRVTVIIRYINHQLTDPNSYPNIKLIRKVTSVIDGIIYGEDQDMDLFKAIPFIIRK